MDLDLTPVSSEALLSAIKQLTHRVHAYDEKGMPEAADNAREQRRLAEAELLKRCRPIHAL